MKVAILHNEVTSNSSLDEQDNLNQANAICDTLKHLGFVPSLVQMNHNLAAVSDKLDSIDPSLVFNIVESVSGSGRLIYLAPALLEFKKLYFTGAGTDATYTTSNKLIAKRVMQGAGVKTPQWYQFGDSYHGKGDESFIVKEIWEHASIGLNDRSIIDTVELKNRLTPSVFAERFIDGREFNVSLLCDDSGVQVLPIAEIQFADFPQGKPKIVGYSAKWEEDSFEYGHTIRSYDIDNNSRLYKSLSEIALVLWKIFGLRGYARVDFRVDKDGQAWVLEVNSNPCLSTDSGFAAALKEAGISYSSAVQRIIEDGLRHAR